MIVANLGDAARRAAAALGRRVDRSTQATTGAGGRRAPTRCTADMLESRTLLSGTTPVVLDGTPGPDTFLAVSADGGSAVAFYVDATPGGGTPTATVATADLGSVTIDDDGPAANDPAAATADVLSVDVPGVNLPVAVTGSDSLTVNDDNGSTTVGSIATTDPGAAGIVSPTLELSTVAPATVPAGTPIRVTLSSDAGVQSWQVAWSDAATTDAVLGPDGVDTHTAAPGQTAVTATVSVTEAGGGTVVLTQVVVQIGPVAPVDLTADGTPSGSVDLAWADPVDDHDGFTVERSTDPTFPPAATEVLGTTDAADAAFTDATADPGTAYAYRVRATEAGQSSEPSAFAAPPVVTFVTPGPYVAGQTITIRATTADGSTDCSAVARDALGTEVPLAPGDGPTLLNWQPIISGPITIVVTNPGDGGNTGITTPGGGTPHGPGTTPVGITIGDGNPADPSGSSLKVALHLDSDNDGQITAADDAVKDELPGEIMQVDDGDSNANGTPDYADGFTGNDALGDTYADAPVDDLMPLIVQVYTAPSTPIATPAPPTLPPTAPTPIMETLTPTDDATISFAYDGSDPAGVTMTAADDGGAPVFAPAAGDLRLWTTDAASGRAEDQYVVPGQSYSLSDLEQAAGAAAGVGQFILWMEPVAPSAAVGADAVTVYLTTDGNTASDTAKLDNETFKFIDASMPPFQPKMVGSDTPGGEYSITRPDLSDAAAQHWTATQQLQGALTDGASLVACRLTPALPAKYGPVTVSLTEKPTDAVGGPVAAYTLGSVWNWDARNLPVLPAGDQNDHPDTDGQQVSLTLPSSDAPFLYRSPDNFLIQGGPSANAAKEFGDITFHFSLGTLTNPKWETPFVLRRPPLVLVHGFLGDATAFPDPIWTSETAPYNTVITKVDYSTTNMNGLPENYVHVVDAIDGTLQNARTGIAKPINGCGQTTNDQLIQYRFAATRVDVVAHSMGGLLVKWYVADFGDGQDVNRGSPGQGYAAYNTQHAQGYAYRKDSNFGAGTIHRFISLDTPFQGSPIADNVEDALSPTKFKGYFLDTSNFKTQALALANILTVNGVPKETNAVYDMTTTSRTLAALDQAQYVGTGTRAVMWHAIGGVAGKNLNTDASLAASALYTVINKFLVPITNQPIQTLILDGGTSDLIVPIDSQLDDWATKSGDPPDVQQGYAHTTVPYQNLPAVTSDVKLAAHVASLLMQPPPDADTFVPLDG